jgi:hypothetical protein
MLILAPHVTSAPEAKVPSDKDFRPWLKLEGTVPEFVPQTGTAGPAIED